MFSFFFLRENMIIYVINDAIKIPILSVRARSFDYLNDPDVLNRSKVNDTSMVALASN